MNGSPSTTTTNQSRGRKSFRVPRPTTPPPARAKLAAIALLTSVTLVGADPARFTDVTAAAGIKFTHNAGRTGKRWLPETMGAGCAFLDADGDGWLDILLINGKDLVPRGRHPTA